MVKSPIHLVMDTAFTDSLKNRNIVKANEKQKGLKTNTAIQPLDSVIGFRGTRKQRIGTGHNMVLYIQYITLLLADSMSHRV